MRKIQTFGLFLVLSGLLIALMLSQNNMQYTPNAEASKIQEDMYGDKLGTVQLRMSCSDTARPQVERGLALLHHMTYEGARDSFAAATQTDPDCAMGYWGQAMTFIHPLWSDAPSEKDFAKGQMLVGKAMARGQRSDREQAYIAAIGAYYDQGWNKKETANLKAFEAGWEQVYRRFPDDTEAASFYALAHMATASPADKSYTKQKQAGTIAEKVLAQIKDHPGAHHYVIHAYDYPPLAPRALGAARNYGDIAPDIPHALHMPTHIFTRLGLWHESIIMNQKSAAAALKHPAGSKISLHYPHALDYLVYAHLQQADDRKARQVIRELFAADGSFQTHIAASYSFTAIPARYALERQQWAEAAVLEPRVPNSYPLDDFPAMEAITYFARALGAARSGDQKAANQALERLTALNQKAKRSSAYWGKQIEIQCLSAMAWLMYQDGPKEEALTIMQKAAELEDSTEKHPVTPGEILPARELLADMLLDMGRYQEAQAEYEMALKQSPKRFNSLYGAGLAAELRNNKKQAVFYYKKIVQMTESVNSDRERVQHVRKYVSLNRASS